MAKCVLCDFYANKKHVMLGGSFGFHRIRLDSLRNFRFSYLVFVRIQAKPRVYGTITNFLSSFNIVRKVLPSSFSTGRVRVIFLSTNIHILVCMYVIKVAANPCQECQVCAL